MCCRFNRRRLWTHRIILESKLYESNAFLTLTYDQRNHPEDGSLRPSHLQAFLKRARRRLPVGSLRFFGVGEYGDETWRPHYHLVAFGHGESAARIFQESWGLGFVHQVDLSPELAQYIAGYTIKKLTHADDIRLQGRTPEFARMSLRPGIGARAMGFVADALATDAGSRFISRTGDIPAVLRTDGKKLPIGRYLGRKLRDELGFDSLGQQDKAAFLQAEEMRVLWNASTDKDAFHQTLLQERKQKVRQLKGRMLIDSTRKVKQI